MNNILTCVLLGLLVGLTSCAPSASAQPTTLPPVIVPSPPGPPAPSLTSPAYGASNVTVNPTFTWTPATGATYDFQMSTSQTFVNLTVNISGLTDSTFFLSPLGNFTFTQLAPDTYYFWRVRAVYSVIYGIANETSAWATATFTTAHPRVTPPISSYTPGFEPPHFSFVETSGAAISGKLMLLEGTLLVQVKPLRNILVSFEYGTTTAYGSTTIPQVMTSVGTFNSTVEVTQNTIYHYRAKVDAGTAGIWYGEDKTFSLNVSSMQMNVIPPIPPSTRIDLPIPEKRNVYLPLYVAAVVIIIISALVFIRRGRAR
jgi:hypothetical protein